MISIVGSGLLSASLLVFFHFSMKKIRRMISFDFGLCFNVVFFLGMMNSSLNSSFFSYKTTLISLCIEILMVIIYFYYASEEKKKLKKEK